MIKSASDTRKPYSGTVRSLAIALDVGTTFSGVSYAILEPGEVPKIHGVTRFPGQEHVAGNSKIPSVMYYDKRGKMMAAGAEADTAAVLSQAEDEGWIKAELFKLRMRPKTMKLQMNGMRLDPLPRNKTSTDLFGDFLSYLFLCTRNFIIDTHANGASLWNAVHHDMQFVLSHPNGWEGAQQTKMRRAAIQGGLIPDTDEGKSRIRFVTEGEASLHACVLNGLAAEVLNSSSRHGFLVADAGGGTLDISSYAIRGTAPLVIEEIAPPDCVFSGSVFVSRRARAFLEEKLKNSKYGTPDAVDHITKRFDETTKRLFRDKKDLQFIPFGSPLDKDMAVGIRGGQLKLTGTEVADLFEPSIQAAVSSIRSQIEASQGVVRSIWLVGGFAASPWLFSQLQERLAPLRVTVSRPDTQTSKAVADGAIGFYCDHHVSARMSKFMYGVEFLREYDPRDPEHLSRRNRLCELPSGPKLLPDAFDCILSRSIRVKESTVFSRKYCTELTSLSTLSVFEVEVWCYRGGNNIPQWILRQAEDFSTLCVVRADLSPLSGSAQSKQGRGGKMYWTIVFSVEIHFGLTEFKARIKWVDNGKTRYGPASIVYNESGSRGEEDDVDSAGEDDFANGVRSRAVSRGQSPGTYTSGIINKNGSAVDFPRAESVQGPVIPDTSRGFERERTTTRGLPGSTAGSVADDRGRSRRGSEVAGYQPSTVSSATKDKGKDRERNTSGQSVTDRSLPAHSRNTSTTSRIGEALTDVWGATKAGTPSASPYVDSKSSIYAPAPPAAKAPTPKADTPKTLTPKEKARESRLGDVSEAPEHASSIYGTRPPSQVDTQSISAAKAEPSPSSAFGSSWGNDNHGSSWNNEPAPNGGYVPEPELAPVVEEPPPPPMDKKSKKKAEKASKLNSKAASVAPTPGAKTPKERSPGNDWANLDTTAPVAEPVVAEPVMAAPVETAETNFGEEVGGEFDFLSPPKKEEEQKPASTGWGFGAALKSSASNIGSSWGGGGGGGGGGSGGWGGFGGIGDSGNSRQEEEKKDDSWGNKPTGGGGGWGMSKDLLSPPATSFGNAVSQGVNDLSDVLGLGSSPRPSKPTSPTHEIPLDPIASRTEQEDDFYNSPAPAAEEPKVEEPEEAVEEDFKPKKKEPPLTKAQQKKKKQQEEKEAKEKADREFQEQLERELAAEAEGVLDGGDGGFDNAANPDEGGHSGFDNAANPDDAWGNFDAGDKKEDQPKLDGDGEEKKGGDGEEKKEEEEKKKEEEEDFGLPVKGKKKKKGKK